jgi:hypothetical protein
MSQSRRQLQLLDRRAELTRLQELERHRKSYGDQVKNRIAALKKLLEELER